MLLDLLFGLLILGANKYGDHITDDCPQGDYACPKYCDVSHIHLPKEECKNGKKEERRPDTTVVQHVEQLHKEAVGASKSEGL
ncbi:MAG: hypothetical protein H8E12_08525 [Rhodobacteraceae bacterium]|nr:hypothetical protein [Paracoccaceae bacterium]